MKRDDTARESLINLSNFQAVACWSLIKDQTNELLDVKKKEKKKRKEKEEGGNVRACIHISERRARYPTNHESVIAFYRGLV